eukprot:1186842-Prorocentrum_minimum.AAC.3
MESSQTPQFPEGGVMSQYLDNMKVGDPLEVKGPIGHIMYKGDGEYLHNKTSTHANKLVNDRISERVLFGSYLIGHAGGRHGHHAHVAADAERAQRPARPYPAVPRVLQLHPRRRAHVPRHRGPCRQAPRPPQGTVPP